MKKLFRVSDFINNPIAKTINPELFATYRSGRLDSGIMPATLNRELITLKSVFRELRRLSVIDYDSLILSVRTIREVKRELTYLSSVQLQVLNDKVMLSSNGLLLQFALLLVPDGRKRKV